MPAGTTHEEHALFAEDLDAGVVAVVGGAGAVDDGDRVVVEPQRRHDIVVEVGKLFPGFGHLEVVGLGVDVPHAGTSEPVDGVEVVAVDLGDDAVALGKVPHPGPRATRAAAGALDDHHAAQVARVEHGLATQKTLVEPTHETDLQLDAGIFASPLGGRALCHRERHRLLEKHVFACRSRRAGDLTVEKRRRHDHDRVDGGVGAHRCIVGMAGGDAELLRSRRQVRRARIAEANEFSPADPAGDIGTMDQTGPASADECEPQPTHAQVPPGGVPNEP